MKNNVDELASNLTKLIIKKFEQNELLELEVISSLATIVIGTMSVAKMDMEKLHLFIELLKEYYPNAQEYWPNHQEKNEK